MHACMCACCSGQNFKYDPPQHAGGIDGVRLNKARFFHRFSVPPPPLEHGRGERGLPLVCVCDGVFVCVSAIGGGGGGGEARRHVDDSKVIIAYTVEYPSFCTVV